MPFRSTSDIQFPTLGYLVGAHIEKYLGIDLMIEQAERLLHLYRLDLYGRRTVRRAALRRPKGSGKSPEGAYLGFAELTGPVVFDGWDSKGQPKGKRHPGPWVQFAAVSEDQTVNVAVWLYDILAERKDSVLALGIDLGRTRIYLKDRPGRIEMVTASAGSREGQPITFGVLDQTESWSRTNGGARLAATMRRNAAKTGGWTYELQNAPAPADGSVAWQTQKDWEAGRLAGLYFDTREPQRIPELTDRPALIAAIEEVYGESASPERAYVNPQRLADECTDPSTLPADAYRFYLNIPWDSADAWATERDWDALGTTVEPVPLEEVTAGFVGRAYQGVALIACRIQTGELWTLGTWESAGTEMVSRSEVQAAVEALMDGYLVRRLYVNPQEWASEYDAWHLTWGDVVVARPVQQTAKMAYAVDRFRTAVGAGEVHHDGNEVLRRHVLGAQTKQVAAGTLIVPRTETSADQITAAKAAVLAWEARADVLAEAAEVPQLEPAFYSFADLTS